MISADSDSDGGGPGLLGSPETRPPEPVTLTKAQRKNQKKAEKRKVKRMAEQGTAIEAERLRKRRVTEAEQLARESSEDREQRLAADRQAKALRRQNMDSTPEGREQRLAAHRQAEALRRQNMDSTPEGREQRLAVDQQAHALHRQNQNNEQREAVRQSDRLRHQATRTNQTPVQAAAGRAVDRQRKATVKVTSVKTGDALKSAQILEGRELVSDLAETKNAIGEMSHVCTHCRALKFKGETPGICCSGGKVQLESFKPPPNPLYDLLMGTGTDSGLMLDYARSFNNAVAMASLISFEKEMPGYKPSVILAGKVHMRMGPLQSTDGSAHYAQLYVLDSQQEKTERFQRMHIAQGTSDAQKRRLKGILTQVQEAIHSVNPYVKDFKQIMELPEEDLEHAHIVISASEKPRDGHSGVYNAPANLNEVSILTTFGSHDLVVQRRGGPISEIHAMNPAAQPLHFTLLFPYGDKGWDAAAKQANGTSRITTKQFYSYHMHSREGEPNHLQQWRRLYQEWICWAWLSIEDQRLNFQRLNQKQLRADSYRNIKDTIDERRQELAPRADGMYRDDHDRAALPAVGRKILSSSFSGGPRWYNGKFQDGMAICRAYRKPDLFITMTCNPKWPEIVAELTPGQKAQDRPDIVARVFKLKFDQLMVDLTKTGVFGKAIANMQVIEFQKRGLPHAHILIILAERFDNADKVDAAICAELPPDPAQASAEQLGEEAIQQMERLEEIVINNMLHGPCGPANPSCPCMVNGKCSKGFPKPFQDVTVVEPSNFYAIVRRRAPCMGGRTLVIREGKQAGRRVDNSWVVPYCPLLSLRYNCHINVEICTSPKCVKYLSKYTHKGNSRAMVTVTTNPEGGRDEIQEYVDTRACGSSEATWHVFGFPISQHYPPVQALRLHLEDEQQVVFDEGAEEAGLERARNTELTAFFDFNRKVLEDHGAEAELDELPTYVDMPKDHLYDLKTKVWRKRRRQTQESVIGRVHSVNPAAGDLFYFRTLLHTDHCKGKTGFKDMLTIASTGRECETYQEVCRELGLLDDDLEWERVLAEAGATQMCAQIRGLFVLILRFCLPSNPRALFDQFWHEWVDDFEYKARQRGIELDESQLKTMLLLDLELRLLSYEETLEKHCLPTPEPEQVRRVEHVARTEAVVIREELDFDVDELTGIVADTVGTLTVDQASVYHRVMDCVSNQRSLLLFLNARGGCGKTYLENVILRAVRSLEPQGCVALAMATTGIAANLLDGGRTYHSRMKAPLDVNEQSMLAISAQSSLAQLIRMAKLLMIDEATMLDRYHLEALDRTLRDLMATPTKPFGGKVLLLAGDFRQCLPVVPGETRAGTVRHCINKSLLWQNFEVMTLNENMRVRASGDARLQAFDQWTLTIGNGETGSVPIPPEMLTRIHPDQQGESMKKFVDQIFPEVRERINEPGWMEGRAILASTNKEVQTINQLIVNDLSGQGIVVSSADSLDNTDDAFRLNVEYLNTLMPNGFPEHKITLKPGMPLMLLRNLNPKQGLCNGTRLVFREIIDSKLLRCTLVGSESPVFIPRIVFIPKAGEFAFDWKRRQFPVRPAFAMTINKSQGQTLTMAGIWLRSPVFAHGQLYVAVSRVGNPSRLKFATLPSSTGSFTADNVVFKEVLIDNH